MIGIEKTHLRWKDPGHNPKETSNILRGGLLKLLGVIILSSTLFLIILHVRYDISISKPLAALTAVILFIVVIYNIHVRFPQYIVVKDTHIYRGFNDETAEEWKYEDISRCRFSSVVIDGRTYNTMEIETERDEKALILIAPEIPVNELKAYLISKGVRGL